MATEVTCIVDPDSGAGAHYSSLAAAVAGETGASPQVVANKDLTTGDEQLTVKCRCTGGTADGAVTVNGFTTDATRFIKIWTDPSESYRHAGAYPSGNKYRIEGSGVHLLDASTNYTKVYGIAARFANNGTNYKGVFQLSGNYITIGYCVVTTTGTHADEYYGFRVDGSNAIIYNSIATGFVSSVYDTAGFMANTACTFYNCTAFGNRSGFDTIYTSASVAKNCISANNTYDFYYADTVDYCASDDGTGTNVVTIATHTDVFTDPANGDFSLKNYTGTGKVIGVGTDDPGSGLYSDDILGNARSSVWDIGAFEYVASGGATYDVSLSLAMVGALTPSQIATLPASAALASEASQSEAALAQMFSSLTLASNAGVTESAGMTYLASLALESQADTTQDNATTKEASVSFGTQAGFSPSVIASLLESLQLSINTGLSPAGNLVLAVANLLAAQTAIDAEGYIGLHVYDESLALAVESALENVAAYNAGPSLSLGINADIDALSTLAAQALLTMGVDAAHVPSVTASFAASLTMGIDAALEAASYTGAIPKMIRAIITGRGPSAGITGRGPSADIEAL